MNKISLIALLFVLFSLTVSSQKIENNDSYYFTKAVKGSFDDVTTKVIEAFKQQGFGVITEIDMDQKLMEKLEAIEMNPYKVLGVCNPKFAYDAIQSEENIGLFLPCKVIIKYIDDNNTEVVAVNPTTLMKMLGNPDLVELAEKVNQKFRLALEQI